MLFPIIIIDVITIVFILRDERYFFDDEKPKLILIVLFLPIIGVLYILTKLKSDIEWYVGIGGFVIVLTCFTVPHPRAATICIDILRLLGKLLS
ncbi:MAG: Unknown protein [uncultured Sulfurovum sp.]|uniref:Uncharacterized protein n=1 Tax=uncultured Sulfurovum sp. TaxID=269237 RepID=A0A6S6T6K1_9BACT|nr:MAG: Unknown protein [uncultured Sulfurovum sp.]